MRTGLDSADMPQQPSVILKHAFLASLRDQNTVLFYKLMSDHLKELLGGKSGPESAEGKADGCSSLHSRYDQRPGASEAGAGLTSRCC